MNEHTPGPWRWELNLKYRRLELCGGKPRFDLTVIDFVRWGMRGAAPRFLKDTKHVPGGNNTKEHCQTFAEVVPGREHHASWFQTINHPDANLIAAAPDLLAACKAAFERLAENGDPFSGGDWELGHRLSVAIGKATGGAEPAILAGKANS